MAETQDSPWLVPGRIEKLALLWNQGVPTLEISKQLNLSKNAIIGKVGRLGLPPRPSPIRRDGVVQKPAGYRSVAKKAVPKLEDLPVLRAHKGAAALEIARQATAVMVRAVEIPKSVVALPAPVSLSYHRTCQFPLGPDTGTVGRHLPFCDAPTARGSYCAEHSRRCMGGSA